MKLRNFILICLFLLILFVPVSSANDNGDFSDNFINLNEDAIDSLYLAEELNCNLNNEFENDLKNVCFESPFSGNNQVSNDDKYMSPDYSNSKNLSSSLYLSSNGVRLADIKNNYTKFDKSLSNSNTIYVNSSYGGTTELGTQSNPYKTLFGGINAVNSTFNNIFIANGKYNISNTISIRQNMTIVGESLDVILDGLNKNSIFSVSNESTEFSILNLTLMNAYSDKGGAIYNNNSVLNIFNSVFENNDAYVLKGGYGGAIYNNAGFLNIYNSSFINNKVSAGLDIVSEAYGGAIYNELGELTIISSNFYNNSIDIRNITRTSYGAGGAIFSRAGFLTIFNSTLDTNGIYTNYSLGGAISIWDSRNVFILNSTLNRNIVSGTYGFASAISNKGTLLHIENSTIKNNYVNASSVSNSTIYNMNGNYYMVNSNFSNNSIKSVKTNLLMCLEDQLIVNSSFNLGNSLKELNLTSLPFKYDLRNYNLITSVRDQKTSGACWAFAFYSAMESYLLKYENRSYDFSENNMKNVMGDGGENSTEWDDGGNYVLALAYLLRWSGAINETDDPFNSYMSSSPTNLTRVKYLTDVYYIPLRLGFLDNDQIKIAILKYGALFTPIYSEIIKGNTNGYSPIQTVSNHAVSIIGWDDNYSASNFKDKPQGDGAFIIKNSWGTNGGDNGFYYISYYDASFAASIETSAAIAVTNVVNTTEYRNNYQYDIFGNTFESVGYNSHTIWFANQFEAISNNPLKAFGFYTYGDSTYTVNITVNNKSAYVSNGNILGAGYHTIKLNKFINLTKGDIFKIIIKLTTPNSLFPLAVESNYSGYTPRAVSSLNESFISPDGKNWYDFASNSNNRVLKFYEDMYPYSIKNASVCLKAYTAFADELELNLSSNSSVYYTGDSIKINVTLSNVGDYATNISVPIAFDKNINISSYSVVVNRKNSTIYPHYNRSSFNKLNNTWNIDNLNSGESISLILFAKMLTMTNLTINASALSSTYSVYDNVKGNLTLRYRIPSRFNSISKINTTARSYDLVNFTLKDINGKPVANKNISLELVSADNAYEMSKIVLKTNSNGTAGFILNLTLGNYVFRVSFQEDNVYQSADMNFTVNISKRKDTQIIFKDMVTYSVILSVDGRVGEYFNVTLKDCDGYVLSGKPIQIGFNGKVYNRTTDSNGSARLQINLKVPQTYTFAVCFLSDDDYYASFVVSKITVIKKKMTLTVPNVSYKSTAKTKTLTATLKDNNNKLTSGKALTFTVNGKTYTAKTNSNGLASVKVSLSTKKTYSFTVKFAGDDYYGAVTKTGKVTIK